MSKVKKNTNFEFLTNGKVLELFKYLNRLSVF
jgi:hypothetical protein